MHIDINYDGTFRRSRRGEYFNFRLIVELIILTREAIAWTSRKGWEEDVSRWSTHGRSFISPRRESVSCLAVFLVVAIRARCQQTRICHIRNTRMTKKDGRRRNLILFSVSIYKLVWKIVWKILESQHDQLKIRRRNISVSSSRWSEDWYRE